MIFYFRHEFDKLEEVVRNRFENVGKVVKVLAEAMHVKGDGGGGGGGGLNI